MRGRVQGRGRSEHALPHLLAVHARRALAPELATAPVEPPTKPPPAAEPCAIVEAPVECQRVHIKLPL